MRVHVKPVSTEPGSCWLVRESTPLREFFDDWKRYGLHVAVYNAVWLLRH